MSEFVFSVLTLNVCRDGRVMVKNPGVASAWKFRVAALANFIEVYDPDVILLQEAREMYPDAPSGCEFKKFLSNSVFDAYESFRAFSSPEPQKTGKVPQATMVLWKRKSFVVAAARSLWLGERTNQPATQKFVDETDYSPTASAAVALYPTEKEGGEVVGPPLLFVSTHVNFNSPEYRNDETLNLHKAVTSLESELGENALVVVGGDFNSFGILPLPDLSKDENENKQSQLHPFLKDNKYLSIHGKCLREALDPVANTHQGILVRADSKAGPGVDEELHSVKGKHLLRLPKRLKGTWNGFPHDFPTPDGHVGIGKIEEHLDHIFFTHKGLTLVKAEICVDSVSIGSGLLPGPVAVTDHLPLRATFKLK